jgi:DNA-binding transcriptional ArsR family regulator
VSSPIKFLLPKKNGIVSLTWTEGHLVAVGPTGQSLGLNDNQQRLMRDLNGASEGMLASEMSQKLGVTPAGVLFLLKPLLEAGIVVRQPLRGGGVLYYMPYKLSEKLSPPLEAAKLQVEEKAGKSLQDMTLLELRELTADLPEDTRRSLFSWALEGGWKG